MREKKGIPHLFWDSCSFLGHTNTQFRDRKSQIGTREPKINKLIEMGKLILLRELKGIGRPLTIGSLIYEPEVAAMSPWEPQPQQR